MNKLQVLFKCFTGPRLYFMLRDEKNPFEPIEYYQCKSFIERWSDVVLDGYGWLITIVQYLSPFIVVNIYKHGVESYLPFLRSTGLPLLSIYMLIFVVRGSARVFTPEYVEFVTKYNKAEMGSPSTRRAFMSEYDFDVSRWPHDFAATKEASFKNALDTSNIWAPFRPFHYVMATWLGKPLAYPGATYPINALLRVQLDAGRIGHMTTNDAARSRIKTVDNNLIDCLFIDKRGHHKSGKKLVITCEGNAGFYEVGCFDVPIKAGYSVLGWNHPGFGYSTGIPFDIADANAIEAVYEYATSELNFAPQDIIMYGWSIGGFPVSYIAMSQPDIGGVIIDASFDDIIPLALPRMPELLAKVTVDCCRNYFNLQNSKMIVEYPGPIRIIRRNADEIITTASIPASNRGNELLKAILEARYPNIFTDEDVVPYVEKWLTTVKPLARLASIPDMYDSNFCKQQAQLLTDATPPYHTLGEGFDTSEKIMMAYYLFDKYFTDCEGGHNNPLPLKYFKLPWQHDEGYEVVDVSE